MLHDSKKVGKGRGESRTAFTPPLILMVTNKSWISSPRLVRGREAIPFRPKTPPSGAADQYQGGGGKTGGGAKGTGELLEGKRREKVFFDRLLLGRAAAIIGILQSGPPQSFPVATANRLPEGGAKPSLESGRFNELTSPPSLPPPASRCGSFLLLFPPRRATNIAWQIWRNSGEDRPLISSLESSNGGGGIFGIEKKGGLPLVAKKGRRCCRYEGYFEASDKVGAVRKARKKYALRILLEC